nr:hypothetical protein [Leclercia sp.]
MESAVRQRVMCKMAQQLHRNQQYNNCLQCNPGGSGDEPRKVTARTFVR